MVMDYPLNYPHIRGQRGTGSIAPKALRLGFLVQERVRIRLETCSSAQRRQRQSLFVVFLHPRPSGVCSLDRCLPQVPSPKPGTRQKRRAGQSNREAPATATPASWTAWSASCEPMGFRPTKGALRPLEDARPVVFLNCAPSEYTWGGGGFSCRTPRQRRSFRGVLPFFLGASKVRARGVGPLLIHRFDIIPGVGIGAFRICRCQFLSCFLLSDASPALLQEDPEEPNDALQKAAQRSRSTLLLPV